MSAKRKDRLYAAIHAAITDKRIAIQPPLTARQDASLADLVHDVWKRVRVVLELR